MTSVPLKFGDFVWTLFPFDDAPEIPGPLPHAACVISVFKTREASRITTAKVPSQGLVVGVYTSSQIGKFGPRLPIGVIQVSKERATLAGQRKPFFIDVRKRAFIPFTREFFPVSTSRATASSVQPTRLWLRRYSVNSNW